MGAGRIRTIKPELPMSESLGTVSRDARLSLILLLTVADDSGRCRGGLRLLSSQLFPYDSDAQELIGGWISELEKIGSIFFYMVDGNRYLQITKWHKHQKIEKPTASRLPEFDDTSPTCRRILSDGSPPGPWTLDLGPGISTPTPSLQTDQPQTALPGAAPSSPGGGAIDPLFGPFPELTRPRKPKKPPAEPIMIPDNLIAHPDFAAAWDRWQQHRVEIGKKLTPTSRNMLLAKLSKLGPIKAITEIDRAITSGWTGIHEDTGHGRNGKVKNDTRGPAIDGSRYTPKF